MDISVRCILQLFSSFDGKGFHLDVFVSWFWSLDLKVMFNLWFLMKNVTDPFHITYIFGKEFKIFFNRWSSKSIKRWCGFLSRVFCNFLRLLMGKDCTLICLSLDSRASTQMSCLIFGILIMSNQSYNTMSIKNLKCLLIV